MQTKKDERREKILTEAYRIFVEKKIEPVSMGEIAEAAGIGRATLFRYYSSKLELVDCGLYQRMESISGCAGSGASDQFCGRFRQSED